MVTSLKKEYILLILLTYSMQQSPAWEANSSSASQEIPRILWNPKVHYRIHKYSPTVPMLPNPTSYRFILILSSHLRLCITSGSFHQVSPPKSCMYIICLPYMPNAPPVSFFSIWSPNNIWWAVQIIKLLKCSFLHSPLTSSLLGPNILLNTLFSNALIPRTSLNVSDQVSHPYKTRENCIAVYRNLCIFRQQTERQEILHWMIGSIPWLQSALI